ncbi:ArnT family glycosyltransferase [Pinibacter aurantiacus]|uniref:Glycosyltransferase family 39 protein n=1 Tax=Pinibacter aurantiacus TaxID=2851599 RepID=A0A9E2SDE5_9BACT|nr:glycosyltransferase family 39 protein [Pinibacter aurantiacus]MBV4359559.1 glycosyltransferase family 39 protein [Pinibacter aurantiacus]
MQQPDLQSWLNKWFPIIVIIGIAVNASGLFLPILGTDGALYAHVAKTMSLNNNFNDLYVEGKDWLDKPHFPFWVTALFFKIFGTNSFAYKLPGLLFWALGIFYTYRFAKLFYNDTTAKVAVIIYLTAEHLVLSNNDVRAEPFLTGMVIGSVYHFYKSYGKTFSLDLVLGALLAGFAVMTKGLFILLPIGGGFIVHWIIKKEWNQFFQFRWILAIILTFAFATPELYALYHQVDLHPEKTFIVGDKPDPSVKSGIKFFLWDSQFGRFFNTGPIKGSGDKSFFLHTLLWAFLPWSLVMYASLYRNIKSIVKKDGYAKEYISLGASILTLLLFSLSKFQLPHYSNIIFPFLGILTAHFLCSLKMPKSIKAVYIIQAVIGIIAVLLPVILLIFFRPPHYILAAFWITIVVVLSVYWFGKKSITSAIGIGFATSVLINIFLNAFFYGPLMQYQAGMKAAWYINENNPQHLKAGEFDTQSYHYAFYLNQPNYQWSIDDLKTEAKQQPVLVLTERSKLDSLNNAGLKTEVLAPFEDFRVAMLTGKFVNYTTRSEATKKMVVVRVNNN